MSQTWVSCGMPMTKPEDLAQGDTEQGLLPLLRASRWDDEVVRGGTGGDDQLRGSVARTQPRRGARGGAWDDGRTAGVEDSG